MKTYPVQLEISGPTALWTRPDTGSSPVSYIAPTFSAVKGIFESVLRWKSVNVRPTKLNPLRLDRGEGRVRCRVQLCAPVQFHRYTTNCGGPLRASDAMNKGASYSLARPPGEGGGFTVVLVNVCYRLYAQAEFAGHHDGTTWPPHAYHDVFNRALDRGQWFYTPACWKEFALDYVGPFRTETRVCETENHERAACWRNTHDGEAEPVPFGQIESPMRPAKAINASRFLSPTYMLPPCQLH